MTWGRTTRFIGLVAAAAVLIGCGSRNADGWWDQDVHAVDGYWVTEETVCTPDEEACIAAIATATSILHAAEPGAVIIGAVTAHYPVMQGSDPNEMTVVLGGLHKPKFVIFDLADGSRRTIALTCGPDLSTGDSFRETACWESEFEVWRVTGS
jgi:hypothetical protein